MKFKLNCSPHLRMHEITKKLFNRNFLSDIRFIVDGQTIFAHSLELMKRSPIFEKQLENSLGDKKLIQITDCKYDDFLEFVRFLYTDDCPINDDNGIALLKLAIKYQVTMLENLVINTIYSNRWKLQLFEYCVVEKYGFLTNMINEKITWNLAELIMQAEFVSLQPDAVNVILGYDQVEICEIDIFIGLARWIVNFCEQHQMSLTEGRQRFHGFIKKIRFPTMSRDEIKECGTNYPELLNEVDRLSILKEVVFRNQNHNNLWISTKRVGCEYIYEWRKHNRDEPFKTKFSVSKETILHGLWYGSEKNSKETEIEIAEIDNERGKSEKILLTQLTSRVVNKTLLSFGDTLILKPKFVYTITIKYLQELNPEKAVQIIKASGNVLVEVLLRKRIQPLIYNNPENAVQMINASGNMLEMIFKSVPE